MDYGVRLDARCQPIGDEPVYFYWRRFEPGQRRFDNLHVLAQRAYGVESQAVRVREAGGSWIELRLRALSSRRILILVRPTEEGGCAAEARATIGGREARLEHVFVQLGGFTSIDHVRVVGRALEGEDRLVERIDR